MVPSTQQAITMNISLTDAYMRHSASMSWLLPMKWTCNVCACSWFSFLVFSDINNNSHPAVTLQWRHNGAMVSQITSLTIVYSTVYSGADQRKHQSSASLAFVWVIHRSPVNSPHKWPVTRKMFPFDDVPCIVCVWISVTARYRWCQIAMHFWLKAHCKSINLNTL